MSKILLYIPSETYQAAITHAFVQLLYDSLDKIDEVALATSTDAEELKHLSDFAVLHVFGCWNVGANRLLLKANRMNIPTVFSPLGGLQPWVVKHHRVSHQHRLQREMVQAASAVHVCGKLERETFCRLKLNKKVALIKNPVLTSLVSAEETCHDMRRLYRKVIDSNARRLLTPDQQSIIGRLVQLGVDAETLHDHKHCDQLKADVEQLTSEAWRMIFIYAADEYVTPLITEALGRLKLDVPFIDMKVIDRFPDGHEYNTGGLEGNDLLSHNILLKTRLSEWVKKSEKTERHLLVQMANIKYELERRKAPLSHLADLYASLKFDNMDEVRVAELFHDFKLENFAARMMAVEHNVLGLSEGFMPITPKEDKTAKIMEHKITKFTYR
jgi:hypothetical protein